jgi:hypothetical protein
MQEDFVRNASFEEQNEKVEKEILKNLVFYKNNPEEIPERLQELENEWDIEKALGTNASAFTLFGVVFGMLFSKKWLFIPAIVGGFLLQNSIRGWSPPITIFRRMGYRTRQEIETEKHALKIIRGDYGKLGTAEENDPEEILDLVKSKKDNVITDVGNIPPVPTRSRRVRAKT